MWTISSYRHEASGCVRAGIMLLTAYAYGSLPVVYLVARRRGVNLKQVGSGNIGATGLWTATGTIPAVSGWLADASKGMLPVLAARKMQMGENVAALAGAAGVAGQCWPIFLHFSGGRGISAFAGASLAIDLPGATRSLLIMAVGAVWRVVFGTHAKRRPTAQVLRTSRSSSVPLGCLIGVLMYPWFAGATDGRPRLRSLGPLLLPCIIVARRLTAALPDDQGNGPAVAPRARLYRLLFDRNTRW